MPDATTQAVADRIAQLSPEAQAVLLHRVTGELWRRGDLQYKFHDAQKLIAKALGDAKRRKFFLLCSRRLGKTFALLCMAFGLAMKKAHSRILFLAPLAKDAAEIATDTVNEILKDFPPELGRPEVKVHVKEIHFRNGSIIRLKGTNNESADQLRGGGQDLIILDECGQMDNLEYVVSSICMPMVIKTNGRILMATTPAPSPAHDSTRIYQDLADTGDAIKLTLLDAPDSHLSKEQKTEALLEAKEAPEDIDAILSGKILPKGTTALREYFCSFVTDANKAVIPEMQTIGHEIVRVHPRPSLYDAYVSVDPGFEDKTGIIYAVYDFRAGLISVEDEDLLHRASTNTIAETILEKEWQLWRDQKPYLRLVDDDKRLAADLFERNGLVFAPAQKQDSLGAINLLRTMIGNKEIVIDPKCKRLIEQLRNATWNSKASDFARAGDNSPDGHYDLVAALKYLVRSVNRHRNPYPAGYQPPGMGSDGYWRSPRRQFRSTGKADFLGDTPVAKRVKAKKLRR